MVETEAGTRTRLRPIVNPVLFWKHRLYFGLAENLAENE
jgi:hypothetical protein